MSGNEAKGKWKLWSGVIAVFIVGAIVGGLSTTALIRGHFLHVMKSGSSRGVHKPIAEKLTEDLSLTPEQRAEVERIVRDFDPRFKEFEQQARTGVRAVMSEMEAMIREVLTPEQQVKYDAGIKKMHEEMDKRGGRKHEWEGPRHEKGPGE
jgi:Spy/CpxP family protein refolding chaperone